MDRQLRGIAQSLRDEQSQRQEVVEEASTTFPVGIQSREDLEFEDQITFTVKFCCYFDDLNMPTTPPLYAHTFHLPATFCANYFDLCILRG